MAPLIPTSLIIYLSCLLCAVVRLIDLAGVGYDISVGEKKAEILDLLCRIEVVHMMSNDVIKMQKLINYTYIVL